MSAINFSKLLFVIGISGIFILVRYSWSLLDTSFDGIGFILGVCCTVPFFVLAGIGLQGIVDSNKTLVNISWKVLYVLVFISILVLIYNLFTEPEIFWNVIVRLPSFYYFLLLLVVYIVVKTIDFIKRKP